MINKKTIILFCWIISAAFFTSALYAQTPITAAVPEEFEDSLEIKLLKSIADNLDSELNVKTASFERRLRYMETGSTDITAGLLKNNDREKYIYYINPPYKLKSNKIFFVRKGQASQICEYEDLYNKTIGINTKSKYFPRFDKDTQLAKEATHSFKQNIQKLLAGRIDTVIYTEGYGSIKLKEMGVFDKVEQCEFFYSKNNPVYFGISRQSHLMKRINQVESVISRMIREGDIDKIIAAYYRDHNLPVPLYK